MSDQRRTSERWDEHVEALRGIDTTRPFPTADELLSRAEELRVPTAEDFPMCSRCQSWHHAGASWPRPCSEHYGGEPSTPEQPNPSGDERE